MKKYEELCEHMKALVEYCRQNKVYFGGCGECGSAWLDCDVCNKSVDLVHEVFDESEGGHK